MWVPNLLLWVTLFAPSIWVADQTYRVDADIAYQLRNTRDGEVIYTAEFRATTHVDLDYIDRKVPWLGLWPWDRGVLWSHEDTEEGLKSIRERVRPHAMYQVRKDFLIHLRTDLYREATRPTFEALLFPEGDPGREIAILIGVSEYRDPALRCRFGEKDATRFRDDFLRKRKGNDLADERIKFLIGEEATRERIGSALRKTLGTTQHRRRISVYFSGYGAVSPHPGGGYDFLLLPWDADLDDLSGSALSLRELRGWIDRARADEVLVVIDAGFGSLDVGKSAPRSDPPTEDERKVFVDRAQSFVRNRDGVAIFLAGRPGDQVMELEGFRRGLLTHAFLDYAGGRADADGDGKVTLNEMKVLQRKVQEEAAFKDRVQVPLVLGDANLVINEL